MNITQTIWQNQTGEEATLYTITTSNGMKVSFTDFGANIVSIIVPDKKGNFQI